MSHDRSPPPYPSQSTGIFLTANKNKLNQHKESEKHLEAIDAIGRGGAMDDDVGDETTTNNQMDLQYSESPDRPVLPTCLENQFLTHIGFDCNYLYPQSQNMQQSLPKKNPDLLTQFPPRSLHHHQSTDLPHHHHRDHQQEQQLMHYQQQQLQQQQYPCQPETQLNQLQYCRHQPHSSDEHFVDSPQSAQRHIAHYQPQRQIKYLSNHNSFEGRPWSSVCLRPAQRNFSLPNSPLLSQRHQLRQSHLHQQPNYQQEALYRRLMQQYSQQEQQRLLTNCDPLYYDLCLHARSNDCQSVPLVVQQASHHTQHLTQLPQHPNPLRETTSHLQSRLQQLQSPMDLYLTGNMTDHSVASEQPTQRPQSAFPHLDIAKHSQALRQPIEESFDDVNDDDQQDSYDHHLYLYLRRQADNNNNNTLASINDNMQAGADHKIATQRNQTKAEHRTDLVFGPKVQQQCLQSESSLAENIDASRGTGEEKVLKQLPLSSLKISPDSMIGQLLASSKQLTLQQKPPLAQSQQPQNSQAKQQQPTKQAIQQQQTKQQQQQSKVIKDLAPTQQTTQKSQQSHSAKPVSSMTPRPSFLATSQSSSQSFLQSGKKVSERRGSKGSPTSATAPCTPTSTNQSSFPKRNSPPKTSMTASSSNGSLADSPVSVSNAFIKSNPQKSMINSKILSARKGSAPHVIPGSATLIRGVVNPPGHKQATSKMTVVNNVKSSIANSQILSASKKSSSPPMPKNQVIRKSSAPNPYGSVNGASLSRTRHSSASSNGNNNGGHGPYPITRSTYPATRPINLSSNGANAIRLNGNLVSKSTLVDGQHTLFSNPMDTTSSYKIVQPLSYPSKLGILTETVLDDSGKNESMADHFVDEADELDEQVKDALIPTISSLQGTAEHQSHYQHFPLSQQPQQSIQLKQHPLDEQQQRLLKQMSHQLLQQSLQQHESDYLRFTQQQQQLMLQQQQQAQNYHHSLQQCSSLASARSCLEALQTPDAITSPIMTSTPKTRICEPSTHPEVQRVDSVSRTSEVVEQLSDENRVLRKELESYYKKISTLEKVEREIERMGRAYESLVNQTERRENLERIVRLKLESEVIRLNEDNKDFKDQLQQCLSQLESLNESLTLGSTPMTSPTQSLASSSVEFQQKKELQRKDAMLMKLLKQNHTLLSAKSELEFEASVLRRTLEEQKKQMVILKLSLAQAQAASNKYFIELENFRSREASVIQVHPQHPRTSNSNENNNAGHAGNNDNNNYFDSYFVNGIQYDNRFIGILRPSFSGEKRLTKDECDTDDGISSNCSSINNNMSDSWVKVAEIRKLLENWEQKYSMGLKARQQGRIGSVFGGPTSMPAPLQNIVPKTCRGLLPKRLNGLECLIIAEDHCGFHCVCGSCKHIPYKGEVPQNDENLTIDQGEIGSDPQRPMTYALERGNLYSDNTISPSDQTMIIHDDDDVYGRADDESADDDDDVQF